MVHSQNTHTCVKLISASLIALACAGLAAPATAGYDVEILIPSPQLKGVIGLAVDKEGLLYVATTAEKSIHVLDPRTGESRPFVGGPEGQAEDLDFAPDGSLAWTSPDDSTVRAIKPDGQIEVLATELAGGNGIAFSSDGRLFVTQVDAGDTVYEVDYNGSNEPRLLVQGIGGLNGIEVGPDNWIYGPLQFKGEVARLNLETLDIETIADGFPMPTAVNLDSNGNIFVVDWLTGDLTKLNSPDYDSEIITSFGQPIDNLAIDRNDTVYVSTPAENAIYAVDPESGSSRRVTGGYLSIPGDVALINSEGKQKLIVASLFGQNVVDLETLEIEKVGLTKEIIASTSVAANDSFYALSNITTGQVQIVDLATGEPVHIVGELAAPYDMEFLADGRLIVAEFLKDRIVTLGLGDKKIQETLADDLGGPMGLALSNNNSVYVSEANRGRVTEIRLTDGQRNVLAEQLDQPEGIAVMRDGRLAVAEVGEKRLIAIDPASGEIEVLVDNLPIGLSFKSFMPMFLPTGLAVDETGAIYLASDLDYSVLKITEQP